MQTITRRQVVSLSGSAALAALSGPHLGAQAAEWPTQPVRVIVNYAPGGGSDSATRPFMDRLSRLFGQQFFVENRGGASGALGNRSGREIAGRRVSLNPIAQRRYCAAAARGATRSAQRPRAGHPVRRGNTSCRHASLGARQLDPGARRLCQTKSRN
jgi:tripartite-type tricarboxylate transporter receptor subunit TctC